MKELLNSRFARYAALIAAAVVGWFVDKGFVLSADAAARTDELTVLVNTLFAAGGAILLWLGVVAKKRFFGGNPSDGNNNDNGGNPNQSGGSGSGLPSVLFLMTAALCLAGTSALSSCALSLTSDGCVLGSYTRDGKTYKAGPCVGPDGKVDRVRLAWMNEAGQELRSTIFKDKRPLVIEYLSQGIWLKWSKGAGVSLGEVPPDLEVAMENETPLPEKAKH